MATYNTTALSWSLDMVPVCASSLPGPCSRHQRIKTASNVSHGTCSRPNLCTVINNNFLLKLLATSRTGPASLRNSCRGARVGILSALLL